MTLGLLHPGLDIALKRFEMTETDVARALAQGEMASPAHFVNSWYFRVRISGTGYAYRPALNEYVERLPEHYCTPEFLDRAAGLPVVWLHPDGQVLDSKSFGRQVVGTIVLPYIGGPDGEDPTSQEVWGIARIIDEGAAREMSAKQLSTSPAVVLSPNGSEKEPMEDGRHLLVEGKPFLVDHLAICAQGVWDKLDAPSGIDNVNLRADSAHDRGAEAMAEEHKEVEEKKDADASIKGSKEGEVPDADLKDIFKKMDALASMADAMCKRMDAWDDEKKADKARRDAEEEEAKKDADAEKEREQAATLEKLASEEEHEAAEAEAKGDRKDSKRGRKDARKDDESEEGTVMTDKKGRRDADEDEKRDDDDEEDRKDSDEEEKKEMKADARVDALIAKLDAATAELDELKRKVAERPVADADAMADAQAKADSVYSALGERAAAPMMGETVIGYRIRMARGLQKHSQAWKTTDLAKMARHDAEAFGNMEAAVYADAIAAARDPAVLGGEGELRQRVRVDSITGQRMIEWYGNPLAWMSRFMPADQFCTRLGADRQGH